MRIRLIGLTVIFLIAFSVYSAGQNNPVAPDNSGWSYVYSWETLHVFNGEKVSLWRNAFKRSEFIEDDLLLKEEGMIVLLNSRNQEWLLFYILHEIWFEKSSSKYYLFEYRDGGWQFVHDFSDDNNPDIGATKFLKENYGLEYAH